MSLVNGKDSKGPYWKKKGTGYTKFHYPAQSCGLSAAAKARAKKSKKKTLKGGVRVSQQLKQHYRR